MQTIKTFSIINFLNEKEINYTKKKDFNFSSIATVDLNKMSVCFFSNSNNEHIQLFYSIKELVSAPKLNKALKDNDYKLNKHYAPREYLPFGKFINLQPFSEDCGIKTVVSNQVAESKYVQVNDLLLNESIVLLTEEFLSLFKYQAIELRESVKAQDTDKIVINKGFDAIERAKKDNCPGSITIKNSHIERKKNLNLPLKTDIVIPFFQATIDEILLVSEDQCYLSPSDIVALFSIDHLVESAYLIQAHKVYPELENYSITMEEIVAFVGCKESFEWLQKMATIANKEQNSSCNSEFMSLYIKFATFVNVASEVCSKIINFILQKEPHLTRGPLDGEKMQMVSKLINFPSIVLAANANESDYDKVIDHIIINPTHSSLEICDSLLGYNEIDLICHMFEEDINLPQFIKTTLLEQYNPMYNGDFHMYPNMNYIASSLMSHTGMIQSSSFAPSIKVAYTLAKKIGISKETMEEVELMISQFKAEAISMNQIHLPKKTMSKAKIKDLMSKYTIPSFNSL